MNNENLKIRLLNAINQIKHLERLLELSEGAAYTRRSTSDMAISLLQQSIEELSSDDEAVLNNFSQARDIEGERIENWDDQAAYSDLQKDKREYIAN